MKQTVQKLRYCVKVKQIMFQDWEVTKIFVLRGLGTDKISFTCEHAPTPFPELERAHVERHPPHFNAETRAGYAEEWLEAMFGIEMTDERVEFLDTKDRPVAKW